MGGADLDRWQDWLHGCDFAPLVPRGGEPTRGTSGAKSRLKVLEREVKELRRANKILRKASAYFAQAECGRHGKW